MYIVNLEETHMTTADLLLAPIPKKLNARKGVFNMEGKRFIRLISEKPQALVSAARRSGLPWEITASPAAPKSETGLVIRLDECAEIPPQGYKLAISPDLIEINASDTAGAFYGACTLAQIIRQCGGEIPCLSISDSPDFPERGIMLDISRDKVPTMETLYNLVDLLAEWKINHLELYTEHAFAYLAHPDVWKDATPMTGEQIMDLDAYCVLQHITLVPNQNSFGHMERWLKLDKYKWMAEAPDMCDTIWGRRPPSGLTPADKKSLPFVKGLFDELLPHFSASTFNVGCDETIDLGCGRSKAMCEKYGTGKVYLDFLLEIYKMVKSHGRTMMFWGDIIMHYPELIPHLPKDIIALEWGYEYDHPFIEHGAKFRESGIPFYVCPGTSSWNSICGRTDNMVGNMTNATTNGLKQGATGVLVTDWGDGGHWQPLPVSYAGFMACAMGSWNAKPDLSATLADCLSIHAFHDKTLKTGRFFYDIGNVYTLFKRRGWNYSIPSMVLFQDMSNPEAMKDIEPAEFDQMGHRTDELESFAAGDGMTIPDANIVRDEMALLVRMMRLSAHVGKIRLGEGKLSDAGDEFRQARDHHRRVWLSRNRPGGLSDSIERLPADL